MSRGHVEGQFMVFSKSDDRDTHLDTYLRHTLILAATDTDTDFYFARREIPRGPGREAIYGSIKLVHNTSSPTLSLTLIGSASSLSCSLTGLLEGQVLKCSASYPQQLKHGPPMSRLFIVSMVACRFPSPMAAALERVFPLPLRI